MVPLLTAISKNEKHFSHNPAYVVANRGLENPDLIPILVAGLDSGSRFVIDEIIEKATWAHAHPAVLAKINEIQKAKDHSNRSEVRSDSPANQDESVPGKTRAEIRKAEPKPHQRIAQPKLSLAVDRDVVFVMSKGIIQALTETEKEELLCVLHENPKAKIFMPDGSAPSDAKTQSRIIELLTTFPKQIILSDALPAYLKDVPAVFLGNMDGFSAKEQLASLAPELGGRVILHYGYRRAVSGKSEIPISFGVPLLAAVGSIEMDKLKEENGFLYDQDGRFAEQIRSELHAYTVISASA